MYIDAAPEGEENVNELTDLGDALLTGDLKADERFEGGMAAGSYLVKAICLNRATGSVEVAVQPGQ